MIIRRLMMGGCTALLLCAATLALAAEGPPPTPNPLPAPPVTPALTAKEMAMLTTVLSQLDLDRPELAAVKTAAGAWKADPAQALPAATALRDYLRARQSFSHPVARNDRLNSRGRYADAREIQAADNALRNILIASPNYEPYDFGDRINWAARPVTDMEWLWQLHRMSSWSALAKAYWHTGDENYARCWTRQLRDWIDVNMVDPKPDYAWRTIEAGIRGNSWIYLFQYFVDAEAFTPDVAVAFTAACLEHAVYLNAALEKRPDGNNWRLMEAEGLAAIALCFPEFKAAGEWRTRAFKVLKDNLAKQVRADGMHYEQCFNYHAGCIHWFARTAELAKRNGCEKEFGADYYATIEKMVAALMWMSFPDGSVAQFGDGHSAQNVRTVLLEGAAGFHRDDFRYVGSGFKDGVPPKATSQALSASGFYALRSGWGTDAACLILKCGPDGGWHCQPDNGTFELFAGGRRLTPDSGCFVYHGNDAGRAWFRQSRVHQVLTLDNKDIAYAPQQRLWQTGETFDALVVENASYANLTHRRAVLYLKPDTFVLIDDAMGAAAGEIQLHFQLAPGAVTLDAKTGRVTTGARQPAPGRTELLLAAMPDPDVMLVPEDGQVSFNYGVKEPRQACAFITGKTAAQSAVRFITVLQPFTGVAPAITVEPVGGAAANPPGADRAEFSVTVAGKKCTVGYDLKTGKAWSQAQ